MRESKKLRLEEEKKKQSKVVLSLIVALLSLMFFVILKCVNSQIGQIIKWVFFGSFAFFLIRLKIINKK